MIKTFPNAREHGTNVLKGTTRLVEKREEIKHKDTTMFTEPGSFIYGWRDLASKVTSKIILKYKWCSETGMVRDPTPLNTSFRSSTLSRHASSTGTWTLERRLWQPVVPTLVARSKTHLVACSRRWCRAATNPKCNHRMSD